MRNQLPLPPVKSPIVSEIKVTIRREVHPAVAPGRVSITSKIVKEIRFA